MRAALLILFFCSTLAAVAQKNDPQVILDQEARFWHAYATGDTTLLNGIISDDFYNVEQDLWNRSGLTRAVERFAKYCTLPEPRIEHPQVVYLTPEVATLVYQAIESPTCGTKTVSDNTNVVSVWVRANGTWKLHVHAEHEDGKVSVPQPNQ